MIGRHLALRAAFIAFVGLPAAPALAQEIAQGGPLPAPTDRASQDIDLIHPGIVARARDLGLAQPDLPTAVTRTPNLNFPLRLKPQGRGASPFGISNFVDLDPTSALKDWNCGTRTYDGHQGNDLYLMPFSWWKMDQAEVDI